MEGQRQLFSRDRIEVIIDDNISAEAFRLSAWLQVKWQELGRPDALPFSLSEIAGMQKKDPAAVHRLMAQLIRSGYVIVNKGEKNGQRNTYSLSPSLVGVKQNTVLDVMSTSVCDPDTLLAELKKKRIEGYLPLFREQLKRYPLSTEDTLSIVQSVARKIDRVKSNKDTFHTGSGSKEYIIGSFRNKASERSSTTPPTITPAAASKANLHQNVDPLILQLRDLVRNLNNGDLVDPSKIPANKLTIWTNDGCVRFEGQSVVGSPGYVFVLKEDVRSITAIPQATYLQRLQRSERGKLRSVAESINSLNIEVSETPHTVTNAPSAI